MYKLYAMLSVTYNGRQVIIKEVFKVQVCELQDQYEKNSSLNTLYANDCYKATQNCKDD